MWDSKRGLKTITYQSLTLLITPQSTDGRRRF